MLLLLFPSRAWPSDRAILSLGISVYNRIRLCSQSLARVPANSRCSVKAISPFSFLLREHFRPASVPCGAQVRHKVLGENTWMARILSSRGGEKKAASPSKVPQLDLAPTGYSSKSETCARPPQGPRLSSLPCLAGKRSHPFLKQSRPPLGAAARVLIIKAPLCASGEAGLGVAVRGAHKAPAAVCLQTGELSCAEGLKALIVFN